MLDSKGRTIEQRWYESRLGRKFLRAERWVLTAAKTYPILALFLVFPYQLLCFILAGLPLLLIALLGGMIVGPDNELLAGVLGSILVIPGVAIFACVFPWFFNWYFVAMGLFFGYTSLAERKSQWLTGLGV